MLSRWALAALIQRFGFTFKLNIYFHMLFLDGVYVEHAGSTARFRWVKAPTDNELTQLIHTIAHRPGIWNTRAYWSEMQSTAIWRWKAQIKTR